MNILLANDTSATSNPGCRAVVDALRRSLVDDLSSTSFRTLPLGYWAEEFRPLAQTSKACVLREPGRYPRGKDDAGPVDLDAWAAETRRLAAEDREFQEQLGWADRLVINGEGSIHHNFPRALALLALARVALDAGLPVHLVNATLQGMDAHLLGAVLPELAEIHVRERASGGVLEGLGIAHAVAPDVAFIAGFQEPSSPRAPTRNSCLLTSGVLVRPEVLEGQIRVLRAQGLTPTYLSIGDGGEAKVTADVCGATETPWVAAESIPWQDILTTLGGFDYAVSGRHHINVFLCLAGVPFVPLPSNTWKISGTLEIVEYPVAICHDDEELARGLEQVTDRRPELARAARAAGARGRRLVQEWTRGRTTCS